MLSQSLLAMALSAAVAVAPPAPPLAPNAKLIDIYQAIHANAELSHHEDRTSQLIAAQLKASGYTVTDHVGVYPNGNRAFGVVGVLKNGAGPTLLIRADMDALPLTEETGLPYASRIRAKTDDGQEVGVMHACGHDIHSTVLIGVSRALVAHRADWRGSVILIAQPSEEMGDGAKAMLADHLYERFGRPDMVVGLHDTNAYPAGQVGLATGATQSGVTSIDVVIHGIGVHGAMPQLGRDPIVLAAQFISQLQTIVSREQDPQDPAVVTVGTIHGGIKRNVIPDDVKLQLTTRAFSEQGRQTILQGIRQMAQGIGVSAGLPTDRYPTVTVIDAESGPPLYNDPKLAARVRVGLVNALGDSNVISAQPIMPSEDVGNFGLEGRQIPVVYYWLGAMNPAKFAAAKAQGRLLPGPHNSHFQPDADLALDAGVRSMTAVALELLGPTKDTAKPATGS